MEKDDRQNLKIIGCFLSLSKQPIKDCRGSDDADECSDEDCGRDQLGVSVVFFSEHGVKHCRRQGGHEDHHLGRRACQADNIYHEQAG